MGSTCAGVSGGESRFALVCVVPGAGLLEEFVALDVVALDGDVGSAKGRGVVRDVSETGSAGLTGLTGLTGLIGLIASVGGFAGAA